LGAIAQRHGVAMADLRRAKGWVGQLLEAALGATASNRSAPDFEALGIELKTVPVDEQGRPRETTFVCTAALEEMGGQPWEESRVLNKLARVLWVPVEAAPHIDLAQRRVGMPLLWSPSAEEEAALRRDWQEFAELVGAGMIEAITAHKGACLQMRPKGANARQNRWAIGEDGVPIRTAPRGFYLRASFVEKILQRHYAPGS
jgi:DNA mismatch repair protein MutH